jgi:hypothetical protein
MSGRAVMLSAFYISDHFTYGHHDVLLGTG